MFSYFKKCLSVLMQVFNIFQSNATTTTLINRVLTVRDCNGIDSTDNNQQEGK